MRIYILTLFPDALEGAFSKGIFKKAQDKGLFEIHYVNLRDFSVDRHKTVDDKPFGGGAGMVLKADVVYAAVKSIDQFESYRLIYTCPKGSVFSQSDAKVWGQDKGLIVLCGYYEGVDERVLTILPFQRVSLGSFVLSSGELPSLVIAESIVRLIPGVLGNDKSVDDDSIVSGVLEYPQYTQPRVFMDHSVPEVLVGGNHKLIDSWKREQSLKETLMRRPELLVSTELSVNDQQMLVEFLKE